MTSEQEQKYRDTLAKASTRIKELLAQVNGLKGTGKIAVVGIGCRFPGGADSPEAFWKLLENGVDTVSEVPADRWNVADWYDPDPSAAGKSYTRRGAFLKLDELKQFDASSFGISPLEAASLDPQQRLLLETSWEALERSGADPKSVRGSSTGVFVGVCGSDYAQGGLHSGDTTVINPYSITGVLPSIAAGRISYLLDLHGPNISLDTACSSSLVAILLAMKSLLTRDCDAALAGGVNLMLTPGVYVALSRMNALSPDGVCRAFGEHANGFVRGEGCGILYLKRLEDAELSGDPIIAVLRGGAMNHDGQSNGLTAPNALSQQEVVRSALFQAGMTPDEIDAIETHGTGTPLGDPIEARSLAAVFGSKSELPIGSVKTNVGHLEVAAGVAGAIKAILMVNRCALPPSLHAEQLNSHIPWDGMPVRVVRELRPFADTGRLRAVGVSSFGFSGTNAHLIVQEYQRKDGTRFPLSPHQPRTFQRKPHWIDPMALYEGRGKPHPHPCPPPEGEGTRTILDALISMVSSVSGMEAAGLDPDANLFELGLDSLMLIQLRDTVNRDYGVTLELSHLMEDANTLNRLAAFVAGRIVAAPVPVGVRRAVPLHGDGDIESFFTTQLEQIRSLMQQQLDALHQGAGLPPSDRRKINFRATILDDETGRLTVPQQAFVAGLIAWHTTRTARSKELAQRHRSHLSDWINTLAYRGCLKEMIYPIASASSSGSRFTDIDGNEYLDLAMGFGVAFFGHAPSFINEAIQERLNRGMELATQLPEAGETADIFCRLTGMERVTFCNTGSEAVMMALRIARTVTGRDRIVLFAGSYHGTTDGVQVFADDTGRVFPTTPGVTFGAIGSVTVLPYGTDESLAAIRAQAHELAAILVEPVQSRRPGFQPVEFLQELREIADQSGAALIFDEMITGFRSHPGGAQAIFDIQADIATYGKTVGGGMPISMIGGKARFMDAVDGGFWQYGDNSKPEAEVMFFGGTFCRHPLAIASSLAALRYMEQEGPALQEGVNRKTDRLARELNIFFVQKRVPMLVQHFGSLFRFESYGQYALLLQPLEMDLFFYLLMSRGIFTWERRICFLSTAHSDQDIDRIITAVKESIGELRAGGFAFEGAPPELPSHTLPDTSNTFPMSSAQRRIYILCQYEDGEGPYHLSGAALLEGPLDLERLQKAFNHLAERHESLRTGFDMLDGELVQVVHASSPLPVTLLELSGEEATQAIARFITPFDLAHPPLLRILAVKTGPDRHIIVLDSHHIALDGFSLNILIREFMCLYGGERLAAVVPQYHDYVRRQLSYLESREARLDEQFWLTHLAGQIPLLQLPNDFSRPAWQQFAGDIVRVRYDQELTATLKRAAAKNGTTLFMFVLAGFAVLLQRLSGQDEMVVGIPVSARDASTLNTVGMFANTIPLRITLDDSTGFDTFVRRVSRETFTAFEHQNYPLELIVERLNLPVDTGRNPLFDVCFSFENADERGMRIENITASHFDLPRPVSMFDLSLEVIEEQGTMRVTFEFPTALFRRESVEQWEGYYRKILHEAVTNPSQRTGDLEILSVDDRNQLVNGMNPEPGPVASTGMPFIFRQVAEKYPDRTAIVSRGRSITYREIDRLSDAVAFHLLAHCLIEAEEVVGVLTERSEWTVIGLLGIMKAGGTYLPLDASYPEERITWLLEDSNCRIVLTAGKLHPSWLTEKISGIDLQSIAATATPPEYPFPVVGPNSLAYLIYTSGSTGLPKGVLVEHGGFVTMLLDQIREFGITQDDCMLLFASPSFDVSLFQMLAPLAGGARLAIPELETVLDTEAMTAFLARSGVTVLNATPAFLATLPDSLPASVRLVISGGEQAVAADAARLGRGITFYNAYGPTETTVTATCCRITPDDSNSGSLPIGRPIAGTRIYILDEHLLPVPKGVIGEICIGGTGVARGYLNRPEETTSRFVPDPFLLGGSMYRSGDLGRWRSDGNLEYCGRKDSQVKVRGFRIEPGEIECALKSYPAIHESKVARTDSGDLAAWYTASTLPAPGELQKFLAAHLPAYMIPSSFHRLDRIPLTVNGKVDRKALLAHMPVLFSPPGAGDNSRRTQRERQIAAIWEDVLGLHGFGIHDSFFSIGGQSLKAVRVVARIQKELGIGLKLKDFFAHPTVAGLAGLAGSMDSALTDSIPRLADAASYHLSHAQKRLWLLDQTAKGAASYNMSGSWLIEGPLDISLLQNCFELIAARHESFRTYFVLREGVPCQVIVPQLSIPIAETDLRNDPMAEEHAKELAKKEGMTPFTLTHAPLMRILLIRLPAGQDNAERCALIATMHHIIGDGWSVGVLMNEISRLYAGESPDSLPQLPVRYRDYAAWHNRLVAGETGKDAGAYWLETLSGEIAPRELPTDFPRPDVISGQGASVALALDRDLALRVRRLAAQHGATLFMTILAGIKALLYLRSGHDDIVVGAPVAGREHPDLESQIGFYLNTLALRTKVRPEESFGMLLDRVKTMVEAAFAHQEYPFDLVVENLGLQQDQGRNPLFDVLFVLQNTEPAKLLFPGTRVSPFLEGALMSKFDLMFDLLDDESISGNIEYSADLYRPETVARYGEDLRKLLEAVVADPSVTLAELDRLLTPMADGAARHLSVQAATDLSEEF